MPGLGGRLPGLGGPSGLWGGVPGLWDGVIGLGGNEYARYTNLADTAHNPADLTSVFTTSAGTTPATPGDPVGLILDISKMGGKTAGAYMAANGISDPIACPGKHYKQTTAAARPILARFPKSGVRNRMIWTEEQVSAGWSESTSAPSPGTNNRSWQTNVALAPDGTMTADKLVASDTFSLQRVYKVMTVAEGVTRFTWSAYFKAAEYGYVQLRSSSYNSMIVFDLINGEMTGGGGTGGTVATMENAGNGWYRCRITQGVGSPLVPWIQLCNSNAITSFTGNNVDGVLVWGTQFEEGEELTPYQKVTNTYDVTEEGVPSVYALVGDGLSKCMVSDAVNPGTDKVTVVAGARKLSDAARGMVLELTTGVTQRFELEAPSGPIPNYYWASAGTTAVAFCNYTNAAVAAPHSAVLTGVGNTGTDLSTLSVNGNEVANSATVQGAGSYANAPLFLMARNQASLFFNGYWFGDHISWKNHAANDLAFIEKQMAKNTMQVAL